MTLSKSTAQAAALGLASFGGALVILIGAHTLSGVGWAVGAAAINAGAIFFQNVAGNAAGVAKGYIQGQTEAAQTIGAADLRKARGEGRPS